MEIERKKKLFLALKSKTVWKNTPNRATILLKKTVNTAGFTMRQDGRKVMGVLHQGVVTPEYGSCIFWS